MEKQYKAEYDEFIKSYISGTTSAENCGILIARLAQYFSETNMLLGQKEKYFNKIYATVANSQDPNTLKPMAIGKADILVKDTNEYYEYNEVKTDILNIEQMINGLKSLQKGLLLEYAHAGGM